ATGRITNNGGALILNGPTTFTGSTATYDGGFVNSNLIIAANTAVSFIDAQATIQTLNLTNPGSSMTFSNTLSFLTVNGTTTIGAAGGIATLSVGGNPGASLGTVSIGNGGGGAFNVTGSAQVSTGSISIGTSGNQDGTLT